MNATPQDLERGWTAETESEINRLIVLGDDFRSFDVLNYLHREGLLAPLASAQQLLVTLDEQGWTALKFQQTLNNETPDEVINRALRIAGIIQFANQPVERPQPRKREKTMAQLHEDLLSELARIPLHRLQIDALTDEIEDPTAAVQYAVRDRQGQLHVDGDQQWVADGRALRDGHDDNGTTMRRSVTVSYGPWEPWP